jgi:hypothetical protein
MLSTAGSKSMLADLVDRTVDELVNPYFRPEKAFLGVLPSGPSGTTSLQSRYVTFQFVSDDRPSHGAHGNHRSWLPEVEVPISRSISGHRRLEHVLPPFVPTLKSPHFSGLPIPKNCSRHTVSPTTISQYGRTPLLKRFTMYQHMTVECFAVRSAPMERRWLRELVMRISSFGRSGNQRLPRRVVRRMIPGWAGVRIQSGSGSRIVRIRFEPSRVFVPRF